VQAAVDDENEAEVLAIMPKAATLVQRGELEHLPTVFEAMRSGLPALADCRHQLLSETMFAQQVPGPCGACGKVESDAYRQGFTKCGACDAVRCKPCAIEAMIQQDQRQSFLRAYHEVSNSHAWLTVARNATSAASSLATVEVSIATNVAWVCGLIGATAAS